MIWIRQQDIHQQAGFTLVEMLLVIFIMVLASSVVFPVSFRLLDKFDTRLSLHEAAQQAKQQQFIAFIRDQRDVKP